MTHAPGAVVPPRPERSETEDSVADRILGAFRRDRRPTPAEEAGLDESFVGRLAEGAGRGALQRARAASERAKRRYQPPPLDQTLAGASKHVRQDTGPRVVVAGPPEATPAGPLPSFATRVPGALLSPLRGLPVLVVQAFLLALGLLLLELALPVGAGALALGVAALVALRVRGVRDAAAGEDRVVWPALGEMPTALPLYGAAVLAALGPPVVLALVAWGPAARDGGPASLQARLRHVATADPAAPGGRPTGSTLGATPLRLLEAAVAAEVPAEARSPAQTARALQREALARGRELLAIERERPLGIAARALLALGALLFPISLLAAVRLRSAYAALYPPILLRSTLRMLGPYLFVALATALQAALFLATLLLLPALLRDELGTVPGHLAWVGAVAAVATGGAMTTSALLGRLYAARRDVLGWD